MDALTLIGERRIAEAIAAGALDDLPGASRPLPPDDLHGVPRELHASVIVLRNAGLLPPAPELGRELVRLDDLLRACVDETARERTIADARRTRLRLALVLEQTRATPALAEYQDALVEHCSRGDGARLDARGRLAALHAVDCTCG
jgi:hypothetical protein